MFEQFKSFLMAFLSTASGSSLYAQDSLVEKYVRRRPSDLEAMRGD